MQDEKIIYDFKERNTEALQYVYKRYRGDFIKWALFRFTIEEETAEDVFSDAIIDMYQNVLNGKYIKAANVSLKTYLFEIGKNKILNIVNRNKMAGNHLKIIGLQQGMGSYDVFDKERTVEMSIKVKELMQMIDEKCRRVLSLFYFHNLSMSDIASEMDFKNEDVAKNKKLKCLKKLQYITFGRYDKEDFFD